MFAQNDNNNKVLKFHNGNDIFKDADGGNLGRISKMNPASLSKYNLALVTNAAYPTNLDPFAKKAILVPLEIGDEFKPQEWEVIGKSNPEKREAYIAARAELDPHFLRTMETTLVLSAVIDLDLWSDTDFAACVTSVEYREGVDLDEYQQETMCKCLGLRAKINSL